MARDEELREIGRLLDDLVPSLMARVAASTLGELEVRRGAWRIRVRRAAIAPAHGGDAGGRRVNRSGQQGSPSRRDRDGAAGHATHITGAGSHSGLTDVGPGRERVNDAHALSDGASAGRDRAQRPVVSPAVGYYTPRDGTGPGTPLRNGDVIAQIDVLGVRQEVVAPVDGVVTRVLVEPGEAVEYGQELLRVTPSSGRGVTEEQPADRGAG
jgi:biotin carboxyl carrier protein